MIDKNLESTAQLLKFMREKFELSSFIKPAFYLFLLSLITSCGASKKLDADYLYFKMGSDRVATEQQETVIQANDLLSIQVYSNTLNQEQAAIFNIPASASATSGYKVSQAGNLEMPVIGSFKVSGLTKDQLQTLLVLKLTPYVKNPGVIIRFLQFNVNVLGEVRAPGAHKFTVDRVTIIDALSAAGDLTDYGMREDITVIREENGKRIYYTIDLRSKSLFQSPVYVLQPNDIVYVSPNKYKLKSLNIDPDVQRRTGLLFNIISFTLGVASFLITTLR